MIKSISWLNLFWMFNELSFSIYTFWLQAKLGSSKGITKSHALSQKEPWDLSSFSFLQCTEMERTRCPHWDSCSCINTFLQECEKMCQGGIVLVPSFTSKEEPPIDGVLKVDIFKTHVHHQIKECRHWLSCPLLHVTTVVVKILFCCFFFNIICNSWNLS